MRTQPQDFKANLEWLRNTSPADLETYIKAGQQIEGPYDHPNRHHQFDLIHTDLDFPSTDGTNQICTYLTKSRTSPAKASVVFFHGMHSYSQSFAFMASRLSQVGCNVYAMDFIGHGRSGGQKGLMPDAAILHEDAAKFVGLVKKRHSELKVFAGGLSMGGMVAVSMELARPGFTDGLILLAPAVRLGIGVSRWQISIVKAVSYLPDFGMVAQQLRDGSKHRLADDYRKDQLNYSGRLYPVFIRRLCDEIDRVGELIFQLRSPFVLFFGCKDRLVDPRCVLDFESSQSEDKTIYVYKDMWHAITVEEEVGQVAEQIVEWVTRRT